MKINIECTYDKKAAEEIAKFFLYKKTNKKLLIYLFFMIGFSLSLFSLYNIISKKLEIEYLYKIIIIIILWILLVIFYKLLPFIYFQFFGELKNKILGYEFYDESFAFVSVNHINIQKQEINYTNIKKIYETSKYIIIFRRKFKYLLLDKKIMNDSTYKTLKDKFKSISNIKYIKCNY